MGCPRQTLHTGLLSTASPPPMDDGFIKMDNTKTYTASTSTVTPLLTRPKSVKNFPTTKAFDSFRSGPSNGFAPAIGEDGRSYNPRAAAYNTANTILVRRLKGRHLQMIAIGGSIGTGLFIGSGSALATGGPASLLLAFILIGAVLFCTVQALEVMAAAITLEYWNLDLLQWAAITIFLMLIIGINLCGVKVYGEAEYTFSILKVTAVIGFIILGVVINCGGTQDSGYIGGKYWANPGAFHNGFKGFCNILVTAAFSFSGTELVGLAAAETHNPSKALPTAIKQVFWRIALFYIVSITIVGLLVPYTDDRLIGRNNVDSKASPFIT